MRWRDRIPYILMAITVSVIVSGFLTYIFLPDQITFLGLILPMFLSVFFGGNVSLYNLATMFKEKLEDKVVLVQTTSIVACVASFPLIIGGYVVYRLIAGALKRFFEFSLNGPLWLFLILLIGTSLFSILFLLLELITLEQDRQLKGK